MKGYAAVSAPPAKRRLNGVALAVVLALVVFSLLAPIAFLLGLHNRFPYGSSIGDHASSEPRFPNTEPDVERTGSKDDARRVDNLIVKLTTALPEDVTKNPRMEVVVQLNKKTNSQATMDRQLTKKGYPHSSESANNTLHFKDPITPVVDGQKPYPAPENRTRIDHFSTPSGKETDKSCQLEFGSYCLWSIEHKEVMKDSMVKRLKDQLYVARAYYPSIAKLNGQDNLSQELKLNIQEHERMLSEAIVDTDLPLLVEKNIQKMEQMISIAKACKVDCHNVDKKLRQILDLAEDEAHFHMKQSAFLYHLGVQTIPKSFHCLSMRLTVEYFKSQAESADSWHRHKFDDPRYQHYVIFSRNILAASVAINSTVVNLRGTGDVVFHVLTDEQNFYAMKFWFLRNSYNDAVVDVRRVEDQSLDQHSQLSAAEFRVSIYKGGRTSGLQMSTAYLSTFGSSHFLLPGIFKSLKKLVVLDDDVVVQRDLSPLWSLDMHGKVNGAIQYCGVRLGQLKSSLGSNSFDGKSCAWMSGLNIIDLEKWREHNVTGIYWRFLREMKHGRNSKTAALPAALLAFRDLIHPLDDSWVLSGLGYDYWADTGAIRRAGALHFNGNMKPWLELGIPKYKKYWKRFLTREEQFMDQCNVNP